MPEELVITQIDGLFARIRLNRPAKHNAMNRSMLEQLDHAVRAADQNDNVRVIVISGNGPSFSAGHDMNESRDDAEIAEIRKTTESRYLFEAKTYYQYSLNIRNTRKPTIAQIHGTCYAAGLMLVAMCDLAIASDDSKFGVPVVRFGLASGEMAYEVWEVGARRAKEMLFTGDSIDAKTAVEWGFVNRVVPGERLEATVTEMAEKIAAQPPFGLAMMKESINRSLDNMGQSNSFWQHFMLHHLTHTTEEALGNSRHRSQTGKESWHADQKKD